MCQKIFTITDSTASQPEVTYVGMIVVAIQTLDALLLGSQGFGNPVHEAQGPAVINRLLTKGKLFLPNHILHRWDGIPPGERGGVVSLDFMLGGAKLC